MGRAGWLGEAHEISSLVAPIAPRASASRVSRLLGDDRTVSLEQRTANGVMLVVAVVTLAGSLANFLMDGPTSSIWATAVTGFIHVGLYVWSRSGRSHVVPTWMSLSYLALVFYPVMWVGNYGVDGSMEQLGLAIVLAATSVLRGWPRASVVLASVGMTVALFVLEYHAPAGFGAYESRAARFIDVSMTTLLVGVGIVVMHLAVQSSYDRERERGRDYAALVEATNRELEEALARNRELAHTDALTQLPNRRRLQAVLTHKLHEAHRYGRPMSLLVFDVDHFKSVNDTLGHTAGDQILVELARLTSACLRASDLCARWGGEEFVVLCPETGYDDALVVAERLRRAVEQRTFLGCELVTVSIGVTAFQSGDDADSLFGRADRALYAAKRNGRNRVEGSADAPV